MKLVRAVVAIKDDEQLKVFERLIKTYFPFIKIIGLVDDTTLLNRKIKFKDVDVVFYDIDIDSDLQTISRFNSNNKEVDLVLLVSEKKQAVLGFKENALFCVQKPVLIEELCLAINTIYNKFLFK